MNRLTRRILVTVYALTLLFPIATLAASDAIPAFNPLCWREDACTEQRRKLSVGGVTPVGGWVREYPCTGDWGKCLPAGVTKTEISFGGRNTFLNVGDFIQHIYRYAIILAGLAAAIVIIFAGAEWLTSGGNSERITSAKKRIGGALMGLFLAYMSYWILANINPALVSLRVPQAFMARPQSLVPPFCSAAPTSTVFAQAIPNDDASNQKSAISPSTTPDFDAKGFTYLGPQGSGPGKVNTEWGETTFFCGKRFFMKDGGADTCFGDVCGLKDGQTQVCTDLPYPGKEPNKIYYCQKGMLLGSINGNAGGVTNKVMNSNRVQKNTHLLALCNSGKIESVAKIDSLNDTAPHTYFFDVPKTTVENHCDGKQNIAGFYLGLEVNDQTGGAGKYVEGIGSSGAADWYAVGQSGTNSHDCSVNLSSLVRSMMPTQSSGQCGPGNLECSCSFLALPQAAKTAAESQDFKTHLISLAELEKGYQCDVTINRSGFPAADNSIKWGSFLATGVNAAAWGGTGYLGCTLLGAAAGVATVGAGAFPAAALCAAVAGAYSINSSQIDTGFWNIFSDPTSCGDLPKNSGSGGPSNPYKANEL